MIKVCARCKSKLGVYTVDNVPVPDPWYCPSCENKKGVPTYEQALKMIDEFETLAKQLKALVQESFKEGSVDAADFCPSTQELDLHWMESKSRQKLDLTCNPTPDLLH